MCTVILFSAFMICGQLRPKMEKEHANAISSVFWFTLIVALIFDIHNW